LLNVFSTRFARFADQVDAAAKALVGADAGQAAALSQELEQLHRRSLARDGAVALAAMLLGTFGLAIACTLASIAAFTAEMLMASRHVRAQVAAGQQRAEPE
jgi:hypothetical protein